MDSMDPYGPEQLLISPKPQPHPFRHFQASTTHLVRVRDCPYRICCPLVCGGWDLDVLGKFFRRRRRQPLLARQILENKP